LGGRGFAGFAGSSSLFLLVCLLCKSLCHLQKIDSFFIVRIGLYFFPIYYLLLITFYLILYLNMVKNTKGGKGAKSMARKSSGGTSGGGTFPVPTSDMEHLAVVNRMFGPACEVILIDGSILFCHIRNKFKGRRKSSNLILVGSILLVGFREWEPDTARKNCDLLFVYDNLQASSLSDRFSLPSLPHSTSYTSSDILFDHSTTTTSDIDPTSYSNYTSNTTYSLDFDNSFDDL
jgi:hypothetical protein